MKCFPFYVHVKWAFQQKYRISSWNKKRCSFFGASTLNFCMFSCMVFFILWKHKAYWIILRYGNKFPRGGKTLQSSPSIIFSALHIEIPCCTDCPVMFFFSSPNGKSSPIQHFSNFQIAPNSGSKILVKNVSSVERYAMATSFRLFFNVQGSFFF